MMLRDWWTQRNRREQYLLGAGSIFIVILLIYMLIWKPLTAQVATLRQDIIQDTSLLMWMNTAADKIEQFQQQGYVKKQSSNQPILVSAEQSLMQQKLSQYVSNTQEVNDQALSITLKNIPFDLMVTWLETIWKKNNITVSTIKISKTNTVGVVNADVGLKSA